MIIKVPRIPKAGETILGGEFASAAGAKGANQPVGAARAGGSVTFIARVGQDMFGEKAVAGFTAEGINVDYIIRDQTSPSGVALIFVGHEGTETASRLASGANSKLGSLPMWKRAIGAFSRCQRVVVGATVETPLKTVLAAAEIAKAAGVKVILNPAPAQPLSARLLSHVDVLTPNESEAELLTGVAVKNEKDAAKASEKLLSSGVRSVIVTMGSQGAFVASKNLRQLIPGYKVKAVDTTAAGDVFNGSLAVALAEGKSLLDAARFANAAAALSVTRMGAQPLLRHARKKIEKLAGHRQNPPPGDRAEYFERNGDLRHFDFTNKT